MTAGSVRLDVRDHAALITVDRPAARNALTWAMYRQLAAALAEAAASPARVAVLRGAGGSFVAGTDIAQFREFGDAGDGLAYERRVEEVVCRLESLAIPTIAVVEGTAAGAGLILAAACDLRVCSPDARFGVPIARTVGNALSAANCARLVAHLGVARAKALLLAAEFLTAADARAAGFVLEVVEREDMDRRVAALCERLAGHAPLTLRAAKLAIARLRAEPTSDEDLLRHVYGSGDFQEGVRAFLEKRAPRWEGR